MSEGTNLDLSSLEQLVNENVDSIKLSWNNQKRFVKVAHDTYADNQSEYIWQLQKDSETGEEFIIRTAQKYRTISASWQAELNSAKDTITLSYNKYPITSFKKADLEQASEQTLSSNDMEDFRTHVLEKASEDPTFLQPIIAKMSLERRKLLASQCPEIIR